MAEKLTYITAFDCLPFDSETATADVLQEFIKSQSKNIFWFSADYNAYDDSRVAEYDYRKNHWIAGRFVGEAIFKHNQTDYKITIKPRFGEKVLFRMLEEIYNIKITTSTSQASKSVDWQHYLKRIIAFIWLHKLANANLHGVPKTQIKREYRGQIIRGRLDVRKSMKPLHCNSEVISTFREKQIDEKIGQIIFQAHQILKSDFEIGTINIPDSAKDAINQIYGVIKTRLYISENDYKNIKYKDIYLSWKPLVDLSWDIIKRKPFSLKQEKASDGLGFFIDMAEVWEQYIRAVLKKNLSPYGWRLKTDQQIAYPGYFFKRELIPDLVFYKENEVAVWDAKYKRMTGKWFDVDRSDFFQIHTYIQYYLNHQVVKAGGLLYPISTTTSPNFEEYQSPNLINEKGLKMNFSIDGIELSEKEVNDHHFQAETDFILRIIKSIS